MRPNAIRASSAADACAEAAKGVDVPANAALPARLTPADEHAGIARLFEMTSDLLATLSSDGRLTLINPAWEQALGWSAQELLSKHITDKPPSPQHFNPDVSDEFARFIESIVDAYRGIRWIVDAFTVAVTRAPGRSPRSWAA